MHQRCFLLSDLLTASGTAMGKTSLCLRQGGAPVLLREFELELNFHADVRITPGSCNLLFDRFFRPTGALLNGCKKGNVRVKATYVAAPSLGPPAPGGGAGP